MAFANCKNLSFVTIENPEPPFLQGTEHFDKTSLDLKIYVPSSSVEIYKAAEGWSAFSNKIFPIPLDKVNNNLAIIIGCSVAGVVLLGAATAGTIVYFKKYKKPHKNKK